MFREIESYNKKHAETINLGYKYIFINYINSVTVSSYNNLRILKLNIDARLLCVYVYFAYFSKSNNRTDNINILNEIIVLIFPSWT